MAKLGSRAFDDGVKVVVTSIMEVGETIADNRFSRRNEIWRFLVEDEPKKIENIY